MAYATSNPPRRITGGVAGFSLWYYTHATDPTATVVAQDYITDAQDLGMKVGDCVICMEVDALLMTLVSVSTVGSTGSLMVAITA